MSVGFFFQIHCCCCCFCIFRISLDLVLVSRFLLVDMRYAKCCVRAADALLYFEESLSLNWNVQTWIYKDIKRRLNTELRVLNWLSPSFVSLPPTRFIKSMYPSNEFRTTITLILLEQIYCTITSRCSMKILDPS